MSWWAVYSEPRRELFARDQLYGLGFVAFCPYERVTRRRRNPGRTTHSLVTLSEPVFPRYLFALTPPERLSEVRNARGVIDVLRGTEGAAVAVPDRVVEDLRSCASADGVMSHRDVTKLSYRFRGKVGDRFVFRLGSPFGGFVGRIASLDKLDETGMVKAWIDMFGSERPLDVSHRDVGSLQPREALSAAA